MGRERARRIGHGLRSRVACVRTPARPDPTPKSDADWCCSGEDGNGLWFNQRYSEETYYEHWEEMVRRHSDREHVIAAELRNELRNSCGNVDENGQPICLCAIWFGQGAGRGLQLRACVGGGAGCRCCC